ncbi:hypothetical protein PWG71_13895 [Nocardiopsis sp. N85]|uniref:hypothetical protein n=1 Tax=Nocardiopsis sp. N85 TaxID=3029400 RepID=UPI00237F4FD7|nr:hypothetical protein [Nocardiopsis sp. N85]MDE3722482.1 hypothetical protein [Nocardiopsis sp. N85]
MIVLYPTFQGLYAGGSLNGMTSTSPLKESVTPGDIRHWQLLKLKELQKGLMGRQVIAVVRAQDLNALESDSPGDWQAGESPELHVSIPGTKSPVVVRVSEDLYVWQRANGEERACPVVLYPKALEMVIYTVNVS